MRISIIVPAFNEELLLAASLGAIQEASAAFAELGWMVEIIVCDNNSPDQTAEIARRAGAQVVFEAVNQIGRARNAGAAVATGDWLVFVDADSHPSRELFAEAAETILAGETVAGGVTIRLDEPKLATVVAAGAWNCLSRTRKLLAGSFIFVEAAAFRSVGGFSHEWFAAEELDLSRRLKQLARQTGRRVVILHRHPLLTSARKARLYTPWEVIRLLARAVCSGGRSLRSREAAHLWYDGRR